MICRSIPWAFYLECCIPLSFYQHDLPCPSTIWRLSHWFPSLLVGIGLGFREVQFTIKLVLNWEFPDPPNQVRQPIGKPYIASSEVVFPCSSTTYLFQKSYSLVLLPDGILKTRLRWPIAFSRVGSPGPSTTWHSRRQGGFPKALKELQPHQGRFPQPLPNSGASCIYSTYTFGA